MFANQEKNSFDMQELKKLLTSPKGTRCLAMLREQAPEALAKAMSAVARGDIPEAQRVLEQPEVQKLLKELEL